MTPPKPTRAGTILDTLVDRLEFREDLRAYAIWPIWKDVVGPLLASRTQPIRIEGGRLFVRVSTSTWMQELQLLRDEIRTRLNERLGAPIVQELYLIQGRVVPKRKSARKPKTHSVDEADVARLVPSTGHADLDDALKALVRAHLRRLGPKPTRG